MEKSLEVSVAGLVPAQVLGAWRGGAASEVLLPEMNDAVKDEEKTLRQVTEVMECSLLPSTTDAAQVKRRLAVIEMPGFLVNSDPGAAASLTQACMSTLTPLLEKVRQAARADARALFKESLHLYYSCIKGKRIRCDSVDVLSGLLALHDGVVRALGAGEEELKAMKEEVLQVLKAAASLRDCVDMTKNGFPGLPVFDEGLAKAAELQASLGDPAGTLDEIAHLHGSDQSQHRELVTVFVSDALSQLTKARASVAAQTNAGFWKLPEIASARAAVGHVPLPGSEKEEARFLSVLKGSGPHSAESLVALKDRLEGNLKHIRQHYSDAFYKEAQDLHTALHTRLFVFAYLANLRNKILQSKKGLFLR